jgi:hypothetical protein
VVSFTNEIHLRNVSTLYKGVLLVEFYMITMLDTSNGDESFGNTNIAYLIPVKDGYRLLKYWCQNTEFVSLQKRIQKEVAPADARTDGSQYAAQLLSAVELRMKEISTQEPVQD